MELAENPVPRSWQNKSTSPATAEADQQRWSVQRDERNREVLKRGSDLLYRRHKMQPEEINVTHYECTALRCHRWSCCSSCGFAAAAAAGPGTRRMHSCMVDNLHHIFFCLSLTVTTPSRGSQGAVFVDFAWFSLEVVLGCLDLDEILSVCLFIYEMNSCHIRALYDKG